MPHVCCAGNFSRTEQSDCVKYCSASADELNSTMPDNVDNGGDTGGNGNEVNVVKFTKLPDNAARYFTVIEAAFSLHGIRSDNIKYQHLLMHLDDNHLDLVGDIVDTPPSSDKYPALKNRLLTVLYDSQEIKLRKLLRGFPMQDQKPTIYLQLMRNQAGAIGSEQLLKTLFLEQLPENVRGILAVNKSDTSLDDLAEMADRIVETFRPHISVINHGQAVSSPTPPISRFSNQTPSTETAELKATIAVLTKRLDVLDCRTYRHSTRAGRSQSHGRSNSRATNSNGMCYYHRKYGAEAQRCLQPCSWKKPAEN